MRLAPPTGDDPTRWRSRRCAPVLEYPVYTPLRCSRRLHQRAGLSPGFLMPLPET